MITIDSEDVKSKALLEAVSSKKMTLILMPTEKCNFRCTYCYEDFVLGKMSDSVITAICRLIDSRMRLQPPKVFEIEWFGGEPLLATDVIYRIMKCAQNACKFAGVAMMSGMTTNAFNLVAQTFERLINHGINTYHISLDGDREMHNTTRLQANGRGSFDKIWDNLCAMQSTDYEFNAILRLHVTSRNAGSIIALSRKLGDQFGNDPRYSVYLRGIANYKGDSQSVYPDLNNVIEVRQEVEKHLKKLTRPETQCEICYAAKPNVLVIRSDGRIAKCTVALNNDLNLVGRIHPNGEIELDGNKLNFWTHGLLTKDFDLLGCPAKKIGVEKV